MGPSSAGVAAGNLMQEPAAQPSPESVRSASTRVANEPRQIKRKPTEQRVEKAKQTVNPVLSTARPLLRVLAGMPSTLRVDQAAFLRDVFEQELHDFQTVCERVGIRPEHTLAAYYSLCTVLDEAVSGTPWGSSGSWAKGSLLVKHHGGTDGDTKVFQVLGRLVNSPEERIDVIELIYYLLSLDFQSRYRGPTEGEQQYLAIRQSLHVLTREHRGAVSRELSPNLPVTPAGHFSMIRIAPIWFSATVLGMAAFGSFGWYKCQLSLRTHDLEQQIQTIGQITPPPPPKVILRLAELLRGEIARGQVKVEEDATHSAVAFRGGDMFVGDRADVNTKVQPLLDKIASGITKVSGKVTVTGHSDDQPIKTAKFPSNQVLSEERVVYVFGYLASRGVAQGRLEAMGKGDTEPVADNSTWNGRATNRRMQINVTQ